MSVPTNSRGRISGNLTDAERSEILHLAKDLNYSMVKIGAEIGRDPDTVSRFLHGFKSTAHLARQYFDVEAYQLAQKVVKDANVDQALEILDRADVLTKKRDPSEGGRPSVVVCVGMPGAPALTPPAQIFITRALTAAAVLTAPQTDTVRDVEEIP